jgi:hypothetical protein
MKDELTWMLLGLLLVTPFFAVVTAFNVQELGFESQQGTTMVATNVFTSYLGGSGEEYPYDGKVDSQNNIIIAGETSSTDFPVVNAFNDTYSGNTDGFVAKFNPENDLVFSTYFGGSNLDLVSDICIDSNDNIIAIGMTRSVDIPLLNPLQATYGGGDFDGFISKFNPSGTLLFSTYFGGSGRELLLRAVCDENDDILIVGSTASPNLNTTEGVIQPEFGGDSDIMILKLDSDGQSLQFCTYFGSANEESGESIRFDSSGNIVVMGTTNSAACVTEGAYQQEYGGGALDILLLKLDASAETLFFATLLGGNGWEICSEIQFDADNNIILGGVTSSDDLPVYNGIQAELRGATDSFMFKISSDGSNLLYLTYIGGNGIDENYGGEPLEDGSLILAGWSTSTDYPTRDSLYDEQQGYGDAFVLHMEPDGQTIRFSILFGGSRKDGCEWSGVDADGNYVLVGYTTSVDLPVVDAYQPEYSGAQDAFISIISVPNHTTPLPLWILTLILVVGIVSIVVVGGVVLLKTKK